MRGRKMDLEHLYLQKADKACFICGVAKRERERKGVHQYQISPTLVTREEIYRNLRRAPAVRALNQR